MDPSVWESTLAAFREQVAARQPVPASGTVSAVSASLALHLLVKALEIAAHKKGFAADQEKLAELLAAANDEAALLERYADEDVAAFNAYVKSAKLPQSNEAERRQRNQALASALRQVIEGPFRAARSAVAGMNLCAEALPQVPKSLAADLGAAAALLAGAARGLMLSVESNLRQLSGGVEAYAPLAAQLKELEREVTEQEGSISRQAAALIAGKDA